MGHFLDVAYRVLSERKAPLSPKEITTIGIERQWLKTQGRTPWQTMKSKLSTEILHKKDGSPFMRADKGRFALRDWHVQEYVADRYQKALLAEDVVVFPARSLSKYIAGPGIHASLLSSSQDLLCECFPMSREKAEQDRSVIQLVSVFVVRYRDRFLTYKRTKRLPEQRLHGYYSMIFGGHLNPDDLPPLYDIFVPENGDFLLRELREEVKVPRQTEVIYRGLLFDDSRELSQQHLGIAYDVLLPEPRFEIGERGFLMNAKLETLSEIQSHIDDFENWSVLVFAHEKGHRSE